MNEMKGPTRFVKDINAKNRCSVADWANAKLTRGEMEKEPLLDGGLGAVGDTSDVLKVLSPAGLCEHSVYPLSM